MIMYSLQFVMMFRFQRVQSLDSRPDTQQDKTAYLCKQLYYAGSQSACFLELQDYEEDGKKAYLALSM